MYTTLRIWNTQSDLKLITHVGTLSIREVVGSGVYQQSMMKDQLECL